MTGSSLAGLVAELWLRQCICCNLLPFFPQPPPACDLLPHGRRHLFVPSRRRSGRSGLPARRPAAGRPDLDPATSPPLQPQRTSNPQVPGPRAPARPGDGILGLNGSEPSLQDRYRRPPDWRATTALARSRTRRPGPEKSPGLQRLRGAWGAPLAAENGCAVAAKGRSRGGALHGPPPRGGALGWQKRRNDHEDRQCQAQPSVSACCLCPGPHGVLLRIRFT